MAVAIGQNRSRFVAFAAVFSALVAVLDAIPILPMLYSGVWDSWIFLISPIVGVLLGPVIGAICTGIGSILGHFIFFRDPFEFLFMLGAPIGAAIAALIYQQRWRPALIIYSGLLLAYFLTPVAWLLPLWGIWDTLGAYALLLLFALSIAEGWWPAANTRFLFLRLSLCSIIGLEADILFRIFLLVPCQTYWVFYGWTPAQLQLIWLAAGVITPVKVALAALATIMLGFSLMRLLPKLGIPPADAVPTKSRKPEAHECR
jgi:hypothetical protein